MAKNVSKVIKLQIEAGKATPAPPVGTVLGPAGVNLQEFCTKYNEVTRDKMGTIAPVEITIYEDRTFDFVIKTPPAADLIRKAAKIKKGSTKGKREIVGTLTETQVKEIAEIKLPDLNCYNVEEAMRIVEGTAVNMGVKVEGHEIVVNTPEEQEWEEETTEEVEAADEATEAKETEQE